MLKELEEFASRGCPDLNKKTYSINNNQSQEKIIEEQKNKQKQLIEELKIQLKELESYAYQVINLFFYFFLSFYSLLIVSKAGDLEIPSTIVAEKQKVIIDELRDKMSLPIDNLNKLT